MKYSHRITFVFFVIFFSFHSRSNSQNNSFIEYINYNPEQFNSSTNQFIQYKTTDSGTLQYCFAILGKLPDFLNDSAQFQLNIPGFITNQTIEPMDYQFTNDSNYTYSGKFVNAEGWFTAISEGKTKSMLVHAPPYYMQFYPLKADTTLCIKFSDNPVGRPACDIGESENSASNEDEPQFGCANSVCASVIKILLLITPEAETKLPDRNQIPGLVKQWTENINTAFRNSLIPHRIETVVDYYNFTNYSEEGYITEDVINLRSSPQVNQIRNDNKADLLFLITNQNYKTFLGHVVNEVVDPNRAMGIIEVSYIDAPDYTYAHELWHLFEAHHQRKTGGSPPDPQDCAFAWKTSTNQYTIMNSGQRPYIMHYSDLFAKYNSSIPTGNDINNNAGKIRTSGCTVASHRSENNLQVSLLGSFISCGSYFLRTFIRQPDLGFIGQPPYTYVWERSITGDFSDAIQIGIGPNINYDPCLVSGVRYHFVRVRVTSLTDGYSTMVSRKIKCFNCPNAQAHAEERNTKGSLISLDQLNGIIFENPDLIHSYTIFAVDGRRIEEWNKGITRISEFNSIPIGIYICHIIYKNGKYQTLKFYHE